MNISLFLPCLRIRNVHPYSLLANDKSLLDFSSITQLSKYQSALPLISGADNSSALSSGYNPQSSLSLRNVAQRTRVHDLFENGTSKFIGKYFN
jgi:hypothetical protein